MNKHRFAYLFTIGCNIQWSGETEETLIRRTAKEPDAEYVKEFIRDATPGSFIKLQAGEFIFCIA